MIPFSTEYGLKLMGSIGAYDFYINFEPESPEIQLICFDKGEKYPYEHKFMQPMRCSFGNKTYAQQWNRFIGLLKTDLKKFEVGGMRDETDTEKAWRTVQELFKSFFIENERFDFDESQVDHLTKQVPA